MYKGNQTGNSNKTGSQNMFSRERVYGESLPVDRGAREQPKLYERREKYPSYSHSEKTAMQKP